MRNYYALGDFKYLPHLCVMLDSMESNFSADYHVHLLALDDKTEDFLKKRIDMKRVTLYNSSHVNEDFEIRSVRYLPPSREAISNATASGKDPGFVQYCWSLSSCFGNWLMERLDVPLTYVDADIMFFSDIENFFDELGGKSIGLVRHRIPYLYTSGEFNVGVVHFRNDGVGKSAIRRWRSMMMDSQNSYSLGFGTCGDQKYLEVLHSIYRKETAVIDDNFGHLAPWNVTGHQYIDGKIVWECREQSLCYFHFAHFVFEKEGYRASYANEWIWGDPLSTHPFVNKLYGMYYKKMKAVKGEIES
jgi:hypothetical protein